MQTDKEKRDAAVDAFAEAMKARLDEKAAEGYTGWDGQYPTPALRSEIHQDAGMMDKLHRDGKEVDIANRCMMLWYRATFGDSVANP